MKQDPGGQRCCLLRVRQLLSFAKRKFLTLRVNPEISQGIDWYGSYSFMKFFIELLAMSTQVSRTIMIFK
jgi:hypothetical protein